MHMSHDSNSNAMRKGHQFVKRQTYLANLQAYQDPVEYHCGYTDEFRMFNYDGQKDLGPELQCFLKVKQDLS